ncbi:molybdopterin molybdotransferase MoeA [Caulobacter sp. S45]|uniref:molybdopterin molybdotransferase MoeA n=1 Tax=Caulobacter sp. S45 TaxID=1641861 RepID=UPI0015770932|nr:molybdopterin molybdotransferase MoeA [Caulobacter sp. S45]
MTQLRDLPVEEARARMLGAVSPGVPELILLDRHALGRVLAEPIAAVRDQPPFDASAMDGYAVPLEGVWTAGFQLIGESAAGRPYAGAAPRAGETVRVFTGASVPEGCAVVVQERASRESDHVRFEGAPPSIGAHVRARGGDFRRGEILLPAGVRLDAWRLALAASAGRGEALVFPQPRVAILSTGEEIVRAGAADPSDAQIFDSNGPALSTLIAQWGGRPVPLDAVRDSQAAILAALDGVAAELIVTVGGASVGDYDLVKPALAKLGLELLVETIRLRPGKPTWFGTLPNGQRVLGLPGNPASGLVAAELFLRPLLAAWQGVDPAFPLEHARLAEPLEATGPREHWMRARLVSQADGSVSAHTFPDQDSSLVSVFAAADALVRRPAGAPALASGEVVEMLRLKRL